MFIYLKEQIEIKIGRNVDFIPEGLYIYVGSAFGQGGLSSRLHRHIRKKKKQHWHIDQLTMDTSAEILGIGIILDKKIECILADSFFKLEEITAIPRFGSSDCRNKCVSHLFKVD